MELALSLEFVRVVEEAVIAAARTMDEGNAHPVFGVMTMISAKVRLVDTVPLNRRGDVKV